MFKEMTLEQFVSQTSTSSPVPGGGSVAALTAANGASLIAMLCNLTVGKKGYEAEWDKMMAIAEKCTQKAQELLDGIDKDCKAFDDYMSALKMPKDTDEQISKRKEVLAQAVLGATYAPLEIAKEATLLFEYADYAVTYGNKMATSDGAIAVILLKSAVTSALYNVKINLPSIKDENLHAQLTKEVARLEEYAQQQEKSILEKVKL